MLDIKEIKLRDEGEIIASWKNKEKTVVSIVCATYNHEAYLEDAIKSFLMQKTDFAFEVIIHDDASTDKTKEIIEKYQGRYPKIIRPIFQEENQFSKGRFKATIYAANHSEAEYIALCEGDDYWISEHKLQRQYNLLSHSLCDICTNDSYHLWGNEFKPGPKINKTAFTLSEAVSSDLVMFATCSLFIRKVVFTQLDFVLDLSVADFFIRNYAAKNGILVVQDVLSVYRRGAIGSWSTRVMKDNSNKIKFIKSFISDLSVFDSVLKNECTVELFQLKKMLALIVLTDFSLNKRTRLDFFDEIKKDIPDYVEVSFSKNIFRFVKAYMVFLFTKIFKKLKTND